MKEISAKEIKDNLIKAIADEWMLITAGDEKGYKTDYNTKCNTG